MASKNCQFDLNEIIVLLKQKHLRLKLQNYSFIFALIIYAKKTNYFDVFDFLGGFISNLYFSKK